MSISSNIPPAAENLENARAFFASQPEDAIKQFETLLSLDQQHLFADWDPAGSADTEKNRFIDQLIAVDRSYPGGLKAYIENSRRLLADAKADKNPFEGYTPHQPALVDLTEFGDEYDRCEAKALEYLDRIAVVLVAGGLGERLGYSGIKLDLPVETLTGTTYLQHYASVLLAMEARMPDPRPVPFIIMTSDDTRDKTIATLEANAFFGLAREQVHIVKQEPVPALSDNEAHFALDARYQLATKPHGHGDVHMLLHGSGIARHLADAGYEHLLFIQDTNGQVFNAAFAAIGASILNEFDFNSVAVHRIPGEAVGAIARLVREDGELTINVEYNQLEPLLKSTVSPEGDVPDEHGHSIFPGNINVLVVRIAPYLKILESTRGAIAEFVNPKYADDSRTTFKKATRIESLMQDLARSYEPDGKIGVTIFDRTWCFSAVKNKTSDGAAKQKAGGPPEAAASGEHDFFKAGRMKLDFAECEVPEAPKENALGVEFVPSPRVVLKPSFALTLSELRSKVSHLKLSPHSTLIVDGKDVSIHHCTLANSAGVVIHAEPGEAKEIRDRLFDNAGFERAPLSDEAIKDPSTPEFLKIRGYQFIDRGADKV